MAKEHSRVDVTLKSREILARRWDGSNSNAVPLKPKHKKILAQFFRMKSELLGKLNNETLLDVIQHCEFKTVQEDDLIIHQGEKGHRFYIILRGQVAVLHKDALEDVDLGDEGEPRSVDRSTLGNELVRLGEGATFGEIALISPDCIRTASIVANEKTDLVVIHRDLYNRSVSKVIAKEYAEKMAFIDAVPLFSDWSTRWKKHLAASLRKESFAFDSPIFRQGDKAESMFFIVSGEVKLLVEPEAHQEQFARFMSRCGDIRDTDTILQHDSAYFPQKLLPQIEKFSRVNKSQLLKRSKSTFAPEEEENGAEHLPQGWSPSTIRKMNAQIKSKKVSINLCYLGEKQYFGDNEFILGLDIHHASAVCSRETVVMSLYRSHFERLFKRRNPHTLRRMAETAELQITRRIIRPNVVEFLPLLKCFVYKMQEVKRDTGKKFQVQANKYVDEMLFDLPLVSFEGHERKTKGKLSRSYTWSDLNKSEQPVPFRPRPVSYRNIPAHASLERKSPRFNNTENGFIKRRKSIHVVSRDDSTRNSSSPVPTTSSSVDSWYTKKSFLPGLRNKTITALSQNGDCHSDPSVHMVMLQNSMNSKLESKDSKGMTQRVRCGSLLLKPLSRSTPTYSFY